ncbi:MAG: ECF transporter S component [Christensenellales bacterium]
METSNIRDREIKNTMGKPNEKQNCPHTRDNGINSEINYEIKHVDAVRIVGLEFSYPNVSRPSVNGISLSLEKGSFTCICGPSGCGKTTLLRNLKPSITPHGMRRGQIEILGKSVESFEGRPGEEAQTIGYVLQNPENQIVTDKVWHELAFGLENLGLPTETIRLRIAEIASFFGIQSWFDKDVSELSGGQKQLLNLAAVMVMQPEILILDEPTSQLDPIAAVDFLDAVKKINNDIGTTVIITEHRLDNVVSMSDRLIVMDSGKILVNDEPYNAVFRLAEINHPMFLAMPNPAQAYRSALGFLKGEKSLIGDANFLNRENGTESQIRDVNHLKHMEKRESQIGDANYINHANRVESSIGDVEYSTQVKKDESPIGDVSRIQKYRMPLNVREGRQWLDCIMNGIPVRYARMEKEKAYDTSKIKLSTTDLWFRYEKNGRDIIKGLTLKVYDSEILAIIGGNGTGKTTLLSVLAGMRRAYRGKYKINGNRTALLPQNPQSLFVCDTVKEELLEAFEGTSIQKSEQKIKIQEIAEFLEINTLMDKHPYDISGGEQQRVALGKVLLLEPDLLLMDEPTKGLDNLLKMKFGELLKRLASNGRTLIFVSHDIEFCSRFANRCIMFFDGGISGEGTPRKLFSGNNFYTTAANRMARSYFVDGILPEDIGWLVAQNIKMAEADSGPEGGSKIDADSKPESGSEIDSGSRKDESLNEGDIPINPKSGGNERFPIGEKFENYEDVPIGQKTSGYEDIPIEHNAREYENAPIEHKNETYGEVHIKPKSDDGLEVAREVGAPKGGHLKEIKRNRSLVLTLLTALVMGATIFAGSMLGGDRVYYVISVLVAIYSLVPFFVGFERRKPQLRELVVIAVLIALGVIGRQAFFMLPQMKPVLAISIIAGASLGPGAGFLVGAMIAFVSNFFFGQGPWTPWQMMALGLAGMFAGLIFQKWNRRERKPSRLHKISACVFGLLSGYFYGLVVDLWTLFGYTEKPSLSAYLIVKSTAVWFDTVLAISTFVFLWVLYAPMIKKLNRIKLKYGMD